MKKAGLIIAAAVSLLFGIICAFDTVLQFLGNGNMNFNKYVLAGVAYAFLYQGYVWMKKGGGIKKDISAGTIKVGMAFFIPLNILLAIGCIHEMINSPEMSTWIYVVSAVLFVMEVALGIGKVRELGRR